MNKLIILAVVVLVGFAITAAILSTPSKAIYHDASSPVFYFYGENCHFCKQQKPILEKLASEGYRVNVIEVFQQPRLTEQYGVRGTPTFVAANGEKLIGLQENETALREWLLQNNAKLS